MWMGGNLPLGYDPMGRTLQVNEPQANQVRHIFRRYLELRSVNLLMADLEAAGVQSKQRTTSSGRTTGGGAFGRGALFHLLSNRLYVGEIVHKDQTYPGLHAAIIDRDTFEAVQMLLARNAGPGRRSKVGLEPLAPSAPLAGLVFDDAGNRMTPVAARKGKGRVYRYYVSTAVQQGRQSEAGSLARIPAPALEQLVQDRLSRLGASLAAVRRVEVGRQQLVLRLEPDTVSADRAGLPATDRLTPERDGVTLTVAASMQWRGGAKVAIGPEGAPAVDTAKRIDLPMLRALIKAQTWKARLEQHGITMDALAASEGVHRAYAQQVVRLAWLSPTLKRAILEGATPPGFTLKRLLQVDIPLVWSDQNWWL